LFAAHASISCINLGASPQLIRLQAVALAKVVVAWVPGAFAGGWVAAPTDDAVYSPLMFTTATVFAFAFKRRAREPA